MAFDQNLEADRIDGFNLFSAFVRVPLLVLGGILGSDDSVSKDIDGDILNNHGIRREHGSENSMVSVANNADEQALVKHNDTTNRMIQRRKSSSIPIPKNSASSDSSESSEIDVIKRTKLSWSDESGLPLVYENDESISHQDHKISPYTAATGGFQKPTKSAMRKSRSIRHNSHLLSDQDKNTAGTTQSRYIPNMNPRTAGNGLIIPTRPYGRYNTSGDNKMHGNSGTESPQWGWYINTTPPTPELYYSRSISQSLHNSATIPKNQLVKVDPTKNASQTSNLSDGKTSHNLVFQNLQNSTKTNPVGGWTSIPI